MRSMFMTCTLAALASVSALAAGKGAPPPPNEPNCLAVYNACTAGGYIYGDAKEGNGLYRDCVKPLITGAAAPKAPPAGVTYPAVTPQLTQQIATCHKNHPKWGM